MPAPLISPNVHVILIHYPLAMLIAGMLIEVFSFMWRRSTFRLAGRWMILIGALSTIPATFSGIYALRDISRIPLDQDMHWADIKAASPVLHQAEIWFKLKNHMLYQSIATAMVSLVVVIWLGASDRFRRLLYLTLMMVMLAAVGIIVRAAWFGGEMIYKNGVAVEAVFPITTPTTRPTTGPVTWMNSPTRVELMFPPLELHAVMAGIFTAMALVSIGLSFRKMATPALLPQHQLMVTGDPSTAFNPVRTQATSVDMIRTFNPNVEFEVKHFAPAGRFWMLAFLLALLTFLGGGFVIARVSDIFSQMHTPKDLWHLLWAQIGPVKVSRLFVHFVAGSAIVVFPIILALLARFAPRERIILALVTLLLSCAVAVQVWMGILLLLDTSEGPVNHFNPPADIQPT